MLSTQTDRDRRTCNVLPPHELDDHAIARLTRSINDHWEANKEGKERNERKLKTLRDFERMVREKGIQETKFRQAMVYRRTVLFGSTGTLLSTSENDLDLCIVFACGSNLSEDQLRKTKIEVLEWVMKTIERTSFFPIAERKFIDAVPVVRYTANDEQIDISVSIGTSPPTSLQAMKLFNCYSQLDSRFTQLCGFVRMWFKEACKNNSRFAKRCLPNSYSTTLLVIHFLQNYGILPVLMETHPGEFIPRMSWRELDNWEINFQPIPEAVVDSWKRLNGVNDNQTVGALFVGFIHYYVNVVALTTTAVVTKTATTVLKRNRNEDQLVILDLYDPKNPGRMCRNVRQFVDFLKRGLLLVSTCSYQDDPGRFLFSNTGLDNTGQPNETTRNGSSKREQKAERRRLLEINAKPFVAQSYNENWEDTPPSGSGSENTTSW